METLAKKNASIPDSYLSETNVIDPVASFFSKEDIINVFEKLIEFKKFFQQHQQGTLENELAHTPLSEGKKSFLVFKRNKYLNIPTEKIAFCYVKCETSIITCFDNQEYFVNYSLEQMQSLLTGINFFRLNRQYLINFNAIKEVERYFARKLLVNLTVPAKDKLLVSKEKVSTFLHWLDNR